MAELTSKESINNVLYPEQDKNYDRQAPSITRIKTPRELLDQAVNSNDHFHPGEIRQQLAVFFDHVTGPCIYLPDDCSKFFPADLKKAFSEEEISDLASSENTEEIILQMPDEDQISLLHALQHSGIRLQNYEGWKQMVGVLEKNPVVVNFKNLVSGIRAEIVRILNARGIPVINLNCGKTVFGSSRHQRSDGWHHLASNPDLVCKFSRIHTPLNESGKRKYSPVRIPEQNCVPEMLFPLSEGILSVAPNMGDLPTLADFIKISSPERSLKILKDAIAGCIAFQKETGYRHCDIRPYNILVVENGPDPAVENSAAPAQKYRGLLIDFESMSPADDRTIVTHNQLYDESLYYNIRRPRFDADTFAFTISLLEIFLGGEGMSKFLHQDLPSVAPCLGDSQDHGRIPGIARSFTREYHPELAISSIASWSRPLSVSGKKIISAADGKIYQCVSDGRHGFHYPLEDLLHAIANHFVEQNRDRNNFISTNYLDVRKTAEQITREIRIFDHNGRPCRLEDQDQGNIRRCVEFISSCFECLEKVIIRYARDKIRRPFLETKDIPKIQPLLEKKLREEIFPKSHKTIPGHIQDLLIKLLHLDHTMRPTLEQMVEQIS